ncbi:putative F-box domain, leucine-rich repeat domain superfamily, F-box-like domain superfamily [Helianthus annuus]|nr:putative F-box domain, leucine-rich repeat domain superfamily, F-box-like domain superfamily [Helianthus annuus]
MDSRYGKMRMNVEVDRLSSLPDELIHKILSFRPIRDAIGTSVLSSRWRFIWTSMPYLNFSSEDFFTLPEFSKFVTHVLSRRNNLTEVYSVKLEFRGKASQVSKSLKHLSLEAVEYKYHRRKDNGCFITLTSTWEALTTLNLHSVTFCDDIAGKCTVVAPQLENLTIRSCEVEHVISAPHLVSFLYKGYHSLRLSTNGFHSLEKADICVSYPPEADAHQIVCLLQHLHNVKFLTLNLEIVELLSSSVELLLRQPSPFVNLKSLKIYPERVRLSGQAPRKVAMSSELKNYLIDSSPGATFSMVLREEIIAHELMAEFEVYLEKEKDNIKTSGAQVEAPVESHEPKTKEKPEIRGDMAQIKGYWENLPVQIERMKKTACLIISKLQRIEELVTVLPASKRANIQPRFSRLCADANFVISNITDCMKIQCDENQSRSNVCFHELATILEASS